MLSKLPAAVLRRLVTSLDHAVLRLPLARPFNECLDDCGRDDAAGVDEVGQWRDWSTKMTTPDQLRIEDALEGLVAATTTLLHVGIGNSSLAQRFAARVRAIDGITIQVPEVQHASALRIHNYRALLFNKYAGDLVSTLGRRYDFIIDNNPATFACCQRHQFRMLCGYRALLAPGGRLLTDRLGLGWTATDNDPRWSLDYADWVLLAQRLGLVPFRLTESVFVIERPRSLWRRLRAGGARLRSIGAALAPRWLRAARDARTRP